jgi:hypothetical protein
MKKRERSFRTKRFLSRFSKPLLLCWESRGKRMLKMNSAPGRTWEKVDVFLEGQDFRRIGYAHVTGMKGNTCPLSAHSFSFHQGTSFAVPLHPSALESNRIESNRSKVRYSCQTRRILRAHGAKYGILAKHVEFYTRMEQKYGILARHVEFYVIRKG